MNSTRPVANRCVVVGAGPVGLVAALDLHHRGLDVTVVEADPEDRVRPGSRAIFLMFPTLRRLNRVRAGLGDEVEAAGISVTGYEAYFDGRSVFDQRADAGIGRALGIDRMGTSLPQKVTERILMAEAERCGIEFRWGSPVTDVTTTPEGAVVDLGDAGQIQTDYVIGSDGARSAVRRAIGVTMGGDTHDSPFIIVDVADHPDGSTPKMPGYFHYRDPACGGRNVMHMPFAGGMRVDVQCLPDDDAEVMASPEGLAEWLPQVVDPWYMDHVEWVSTYRFHQVVADSYTDANRRVLLAGEAAHLFAPFGGRGLNSGVIDATHSAAAIEAAVAAPDHAAAIIEKAANERRRWGLHNRGVSSRALKVMTGDDILTNVTRRIAGRVAPVFPPAGAWLANGPIQLPTPRIGSTDLY